MPAGVFIEHQSQNVNEQRACETTHTANLKGKKTNEITFLLQVSFVANVYRHYVRDVGVRFSLTWWLRCNEGLLHFLNTDMFT